MPTDAVVLRTVIAAIAAEQGSNMYLDDTELELLSGVGTFAPLQATSVVAAIFNVNVLVDTHNEIYRFTPNGHVVSDEELANVPTLRIYYSNNHFESLIPEEGEIYLIILYFEIF